MMNTGWIRDMNHPPMGQPIIRGNPIPTMTKDWHKYPNPERLSHGQCKWCGKDVKIIDEDNPDYHERCLKVKLVSQVNKKTENNKESI